MFKRKFDKYLQNLEYDSSYIYSYGTKVAKIDGDNLVKLGYWSPTTSKHINYAASQLGLRVL